MGRDHAAHLVDEKGNAILEPIPANELPEGDWRKYPDNTEWGINIRNATKKTKCSVYFVPKPIPIIEKVNKAYLANKSSFATDDPDSNIRYIGADPNNYVYFKTL